MCSASLLSMRTQNYNSGKNKNSNGSPWQRGKNSKASERNVKEKGKRKTKSKEWKEKKTRKDVGGGKVTRASLTERLEIVWLNARTVVCNLDEIQSIIPGFDCNVRSPSIQSVLNHFLQSNRQGKHDLSRADAVHILLSDLLDHFSAARAFLEVWRQHTRENKPKHQSTFVKHWFPNWEGAEGEKKSAEEGKRKVHLSPPLSTSLHLSPPLSTCDCQGLVCFNSNLAIEHTKTTTTTTTTTTRKSLRQHAPPARYGWKEVGDKKQKKQKKPSTGWLETASLERHTRRGAVNTVATRGHWQMKQQPGKMDNSGPGLAMGCLGYASPMAAAAAGCWLLGASR